MVIRYRGTSPKLGGCQGEFPYPSDYVSFFGGGDVIFLAMIPLRIRFSSSSLLTWRLRSIISFRSFQDDWVSSYTEQVSHTWKYFFEGAYSCTQRHYPQAGGPLTLDVRLSIINNSTFFTSKGDIIIWAWALPLATAKLGGGAPVSYHHHAPIFTLFLSSIFLVLF